VSRPIFAVEGAGKSFGGRAVLKSASVWAYAGRITALFGRNGCGKSTLLKFGAGLTGAEYGSVQFAGRAYLRARLPDLARDGLFYLPSEGLLSPRMTLRQHLHALRFVTGGADAMPTVERLGLAGLLDQDVGEFSGGERRRAEVSLAVARAPVCLLADEPFAGVSPADAEVLGGVFREMAGRGCAMVITGHEVPQLMRIADDVVWMTEGSTHHLGTPAQAAVNEQFRRGYLGPGRWTVARTPG
jgi:ABC-type multidrug transport system ATPase subunit